MARTLSAAGKRKLARDGYAVLRGLVPGALARAALSEIENGLPERERGRGADEFLSYHLSSAPVLDLLQATPLRGLVDSLLGAGNAEPCTQAQIALRFPSSGPAPERAQGVHVDWLKGGRPSDGDRFTLCAGVALSAAPRADMGNLVVYPGTHARLSRAIARGGLAAVRGGPASAVALPRPVPLRLQVGDVVLFHYQTVHAAAVNRSPRVRCMVYFRVYHVDAWRARSRDYLRRALTEPWLEWPGMRRSLEA